MWGQPWLFLRFDLTDCKDILICFERQQLFYLNTEMIVK